MGSQKFGAIFSGMTLAIIATLTLIFVLNFSLIISIVIGFATGSIVTIILIARSRGEKPEDIAKEVIQEVINLTPDSISHRVEEQLLQLNLDIRLQTPHADVISTCEAIIDQLLEVVPLAVKNAPDSEASFDLEKLSTDYFPDLVRHFIHLSASDQKQQHSDFLKQLKELSDTAEKAKKAIEQGQLNSFKVSKSFVSAKYTGNT